MPKELTPEQALSIFGPDVDAPVEAAPPAKEENTAPEAKADDNPPETKDAATEEATEEVVDSDLERAWSALERDGWSKADLKRMSVDRIKELGTKRAKNHEDIDNAYKDLKSLKEAARKTDKPEPVLDRAAVTVDPSEALKALEAEFGPEGAKAVHSALKPVLDELAALKSAEAERQKATAQSERIRLQTSFKGLYPEIDKPAVWDAVVLVAQGKAEDGMSADDALKLALHEVYGERKPQAVPKRSERVKDTPEAPSRSGAPKPMTKDERELRVLELLESGASKDDARKVLNN